MLTTFRHECRRNVQRLTIHAFSLTLADINSWKRAILSVTGHKMSAVRGGTRPHTLGVTLRRPSANTPWGIRIVGGADTGSAIVITRVSGVG
jgi:hypothetical protein